METHRLHQLQEFIRRVVALNLPDAMWISAETSQVKEVRGHYFLDLVEKSDESDEVIAQASAVLWQNSFRRIRRQRGRSVKEVLSDGLHIRLQVRTDFHERYGMRLLVEDIDPAFTLGQLESQRRASLARLQAEGAIDKNGSLYLAPVLQRIAVISSATAAGYADFCDQLFQNEYGYRFHHQLFPAAMQGQAAPTEIITQLKAIARRADQYDTIVIVRGGGARLDLAAFDDLELCRAIANAPLAVLSGIGHETDESLVDKVAHTTLKTPTALANFILDRHLQFESKVLELGRQIAKQTQSKVQAAFLRISNIHQRIQLLAKNQVLQQHLQIQTIKEVLIKQAHHNIRLSNVQLDQWEVLVRALNPKQILAQGFTWIEQDGQQLKEKQRLKSGDQISIHFRDGKVDAIIENS